MNASATILITGATSGIGRATALALANKGYRVFATGRRAAALAALAAEARGTRLETVVMDVADPTSIAAARRAIDAETRGYGVDAVVNNAGYGAMGPIEEISDEAVRAQYETNVFGLLAVTRAFLPAMRARGFGRIVNISSVGGRVTAPLMGVYSSTKYAVESLSDALRIELRPFGVQVVLIEPGAIATGFSEVAVGTVPGADGSPYASAIAGTGEIFARLARAAVGTEHVTSAIEKALFSKRPAARYVRPWRTYALLWLAALLPTPVLDAAMGLLAGLRKRKLARSALARALTVGLLLLGSAQALAAGWEKISEQEGVTIERRAHPGSQFDELRATTTCPVPPARFFAAVWNYRAFPEFVPYLKSLRVLDERGDKSHVYQQVAMPLVADRDYTLELTRQIDTGTQVYQMSFDSADAAGPLPHEPFVRAQNIHGDWTLEPIDGGKRTLVTYRLYSEPGGEIPSWIVNLAQRSAPRELLLAMSKRALQQR